MLAWAGGQSKGPMHFGRCPERAERVEEVPS